MKERYQEDCSSEAAYCRFRICGKWITTGRHTLSLGGEQQVTMQSVHISHSSPVVCTTKGGYWRTGFRFCASRARTKFVYATADLIEAAFQFLLDHQHLVRRDLRYFMVVVMGAFMVRMRFVSWNLHYILFPCLEK